MSDSKSEIVVYSGSDRVRCETRGEPVTARNAPAIVKAAGRPAEFAWEEFFQAEIANAHTRKNYIHAVKVFLAWCQERDLQLIRVTPGDVGAYFQELPSAVPTKKLHLAALRRVLRPPGQPPRLVVINPAATVQGRAVFRGRGQDAGDPLATRSARLLTSIDLYRPRLVSGTGPILAVLVYTAATRRRRIC